MMNIAPVFSKHKNNVFLKKLHTLVSGTSRTVLGWCLEAMVFSRDLLDLLLNSDFCNQKLWALILNAALNRHENFFFDK